MTPTHPLALDTLDLRILAELQQDCSISNLELARRVHSSPATCLRRVQSLKDAGVIERQVAVIAPAALGATVTAIVEVTLDAQNAERIAGFQALVQAEPAVTQCYQVSPGPDLVLIVTVRDMPEFQSLSHRLFTAQNHVRNLRVYFAISRSKFGTELPLPATAPR